YGSAVILSLPGEGGQDARLDQALDLLAQARRLRPNWGQSLLLTAGIYDQKGDQELALQNYVRAIELGEGNATAYRRAVDLLTQAGRHDESADIMKRLMQREETISPEDMRRQGIVDWGQGDLDSALRYARDVATSSQRYQDHIWLGQLLARKARIAEDASKEEEAQQLATEAEQAYLHAVSLADTTAATWVSLIYFYTVHGDTQKAQESLAKAEAKIPADEATLAMAQIYEAMGQAEKAQKQYEDAVKDTPGDVDLVQRLVQFYVRTGKAPQAETQLNRILSGKLDANQEVLAWARRQQANILAVKPGYKNLQQAIGLIEENLAAEPTSPQDTRLLATLLARSPSHAQQERAIRTLESLPAPSADDRFILARLYLAQGNWAKGVASMRDLLAKYADQPQYLAAYVDAMLQRDQLQSVEMYLNTLERLAPNQFGVVSLRAEFLFRQAQYLPALNLLTDFLNRSDAIPTDEGQRLARVATRLEQFLRRLNESASKAKSDAEREALEAVAERYASEAERMYRAYVSDRPSLRMLLAAFLGRQGKIDESLQLVEQIWSDSPPDVMAQMMVILLKSPEATPEQLGRADKILQASLTKFQTSASLKLAAGDIRSTQGRYKESETIYRSILRADPSNAVAKNNLAVLLAQQKIKLDEAEKLINEAIATAGPIGSMLDSRATVNLALGHTQKALDDLKLAINQEETPVRLFHQAQALQQAGQQAEAARAWKKAEEAGLDAEMIQNLERPIYDKLKKELKSG
ncbi:MAG TPA: tetratricopeptide repeat protein, partial [Thermoguttaceae bacterium]|nr:tetratricopeptide repeat protein [Thermoguttaceae bacterium]